MSYPTYETGNPSGKILVFLAGFPDDCVSGWGNVIPLLSATNKYRILCLCMPGYDNKTPIKPWGYDFKELVSMLESTIDSLIPKDQKFHFIVHDWGSVIGSIYENRHPDRLEKMVIIDVGMIDGPMKIRDYLTIAFYQSWFATSFAISQLISFSLGDFLFKLFHVLPFIKYIGPTPFEKIIRPHSEVTVAHCYPYWHFFPSVALGKVKMPEFPSRPFFYMFGLKKNCMFHSASFLKRIEATPGCRHKAYNTGHWIMLAEPQQVADDIFLFLNHNSK